MTNHFEILGFLQLLSLTRKLAFATALANGLLCGFVLFVLRASVVETEFPKVQEANSFRIAPHDVPFGRFGQVVRHPPPR